MHATVIFLGHEVGQGPVSPVQGKVEAIFRLPPPVNPFVTSPGDLRDLGSPF